MKLTHILKTACLITLCSVPTLKAFAYPVTFTFTGHVTDANFQATQGSAVLFESNDPNSAVSWNGINAFNGDSYFSGTMTFDSGTTSLQPPNTYYSQSDYAKDPSTGYRGVTYQLSTEGISFVKTPGIWSFMSFYNNANQVVINAEDDVLTNTGSINFIYQSLTFNFNNGEFIGGAFSLTGDGPRPQLDVFTRGILTGQIDTLSISQIPVPSAAWLFGSGLVGLATTIRKRKFT
jgi:hypothetical protein